MKKVLFIIGQLGAGGAERVLIDIANNLSISSGYSVTIFTFCKNKLDSQISKNVRHVSFLNIDVSSRKFIPRILSRLFVKNLFRMLERLNPEFIRKIMSNYLKESYDVEVASVEGLPIKISSSGKYINSSKRVGWIHTDLSRNNHAKNFFANYLKEKESYSNIQKMIFVSEQSKDGYRDYFGEYHPNSYVIQNFIDCKRIKRLSFQKNNINFKYICSVGRLVEEKGFDRLIKAYSSLKEKEKFNEIKLVIIGSGYQKDELDKLVQALGLLDDVIIIPFTENPYKYIKNSEFFISSSRVEGYSLVVAEALLLEVPIISTRTGAVSILGESNYGLVVENSFEGLEKGMEEMLVDINKYKQKAILGSKKIEEVNIEKMEEIISVFNR